MQSNSGGNATSYNWPATVAMLRALDALQAAESAIDERGGGTETIYETLRLARERIEAEVAALVVADACLNQEARP